MKELRSVGVILAIATIASLIFVAIWAYNNHFDLNKRIDQHTNIQHGIIEFIKKTEQDIGTLKTGLTELTEVFKDQQKQLNKCDSRYIISSLQVIGDALKKNDSTFSLPPLKKKKSRRSRKYETDSEESGDESDSDLENEIKRRKDRRRH